MADIERVLNQYLWDTYKTQQILKELSKFFVDYHVQIRLAGNPPFLQTSAGNKFYEEFKKECVKMSRATVRVRDENDIERVGPLGFFTMYHYRNKNVGDNNERL
jgi:hypothetical protein